MKRAGLFLLIAMLAAPFSTFAQNEETGLYVGDVSNSGCKSQTRSESVRGNTILKLTRDGDNLYGELTDFYANCAINGIAIECKEEDHTLNITAEEEFEGIERADCICPYNVSFTLFNAKEKQYALVVNGRKLGDVSFESHSVVEIDITTLEQAHEEGFEYPVKVGDFSPYEITNWIKPGEIRKSELTAFYFGNDWEQDFVYLNYRLPKEYTYLNALARLEADSTLVMDIITDGSSTEGSDRMANLTIQVINVETPLNHLRLNHKVVTIDDHGMTDKEVLLLYEGDLDWRYDGWQSNESKTIGLKDITEYRKDAALNVQPVIPSFTENGRLYDFTGRQIIGHPQRGIYIRNGRKVIIK